MTSRELVKSAITHHSMDKQPYCICFTTKAKEKYWEQLVECYFADEIKYALKKGIINERDALNIAIGNDVFTCFDAPWWGWCNVPEGYNKSYDAPESIPKTIGLGSYELFKDKLKWIKENTNTYITVMIYGSHFEKANACRGIEYFLGDIGINKNYAKKLLDTIIQKNIVMLENFLELTEIDGVLLGSDWGSQRSLLMSPDTWRELIAPGEKKEYDLIKESGKDVWIHSCGNIQGIIPDLINMGVDVLNPIQPEAMDIFKLKHDYGDKITFWGGISTQQTLPYGTADEVKQEIQRVVPYMSKNGGYIMAPAQEIQEDVPFENIAALIDELKQHSGK